MNKSYKQFSLTTLQLPAPSSSLTKVEYKDVYGIDLDSVDIPSFKLVVYGNDKYAIDQVKAIEGGYEIYFNGRVLSITDTIETSNEVYDVANAKPLYIHPITGEISGSLGFSLFVFNNSDTPLNTWAKIKSYMQSLAVSMNADARFNCAGCFIKESKQIIAYVMTCTTLGVVTIYGINDAGTVESLNITNLSITPVYDPVNKIN